MIFNGKDLRNYFKILSIEKSLLPPISTTTTRVPGMPGERFRKNILGSKRFDIKIELSNNDLSGLNNLIRELAATAYTREPKELRLPDEMDKYYLVTLNGNTNLERMHNYRTTDLIFIANDPIAYGQQKQFDITNNPTIYNLGTYPTKGKITIEITENIDHIQVTLLNTGEFIYLGHNFIPGDIVTIDLGEEMAYKNGYSIMQDCYLESDFFEIPTGKFEITVSSGKATLEYIERWL